MSGIIRNDIQLRLYYSKPTGHLSNTENFFKTIKAKHLKFKGKKVNKYFKVCLLKL